MIIDKINLNHLRLFECVYRTQSMTQASKELHLTQSGVSQHIKALENSIDIKLFDRVRQKLMPTAQAIALYEKCRQSLYSLEQTLENIKGLKKELSGTVSIGMPIEFGNNCVMPTLSKYCKKHPLLNLDIRFGYAYEMNDQLLNGKLDFALVDSFGFDKRISTEKVYDEILVLCASKNYLKNKKPLREEKKFFESLHYIEYLRGAPVLKMWFNHHFTKKHFEFNVRATIMEVEGVAKMILSGLGAGVLPSHHLLKLGPKVQQLHQFKGTKLPLKNTISIAYLSEKTQSSATSQVLSWLTQELKSIE